MSTCDLWIANMQFITLNCVLCISNVRFINRKCEIYAASRGNLLLRARTLITDLARKFRKRSLPKWDQVHNLSWEWKTISMSMAEHLTSFWYRGPGELGNGRLSLSWRGCATRLSKFWPYFRPKNFIFHTRFQTWPPRNYVITLRLEHQQKRFLISPISLSFLLIWNWKDKYVHTFP